MMRPDNDPNKCNPVNSDHCVSPPPPILSRITVRVQILKRLPFNPDDDDVDELRLRHQHHHRAHARARTSSRRRHGSNSKRRYLNDEHATVYIETALSSSNDIFSVSTNGWATCRLMIRKICTGHEDNNHHNNGNNNNLLLWAPVVLKCLPSHPRPVVTPSTGDIDNYCDWTLNKTIIGDDNNYNASNHDHHIIPTLFIPPCLAATLGLHNLFHVHRNQTSTIAHLQHLPNNEITTASHATLRELGRPPPIPILKWPLTSSSAVSLDDGNQNEEKQLRKFFMYPPSTAIKNPSRSSLQKGDNTDHRMNSCHCCRSIINTTKSKPRQRLLALGTIFAVPIYDNEKMSNDFIACTTEENIDDVIQNVRFYQVTDIRPMTNGESADKQVQNMMAYIISPSTHLVLLPPSSEIMPDSNDNPNNNISMNERLVHPQLKGGTMINGYTWRLPSPTVVVSFLRSVSLQLANLPLVAERVAAISTTPSSTTIQHPSAQALADAFYLQGSFSSRLSVQRLCHICHNKLDSTALLSSSAHYDSDPCIIHIIGKEENHTRACVDEAANIMGMRSFHVEGLAAFWAHYSLFNTYSQPKKDDNNSSFTPQLTGALPDKLRGLSASLDIARQSSPCVLHVVDIDRELSATEGHASDLDARKDEERRILETIRAGTSFFRDSSCLAVGCDRITTTPPVIVVISTSRPLPPGPLSSSLIQSSIEISAPDTNYARVLWDNDADGTFECLSTYLIGLSAREIRYLRGSFSTLWKKDEQHEQSSPLDILQSLLPQLETRRSFLQSSGSNGSSSTLPLSSSSIPNVRWEDIGGLESIRKEIMDAVELPLKYPHYFEGSRRSGILLFGPPGTGKTLVAKAVARECGLPFLSIKGPELLGSYVGESEANIRAVFDAARSAAMTPVSSPLKGEKSGGYNGASILFFDEIDSLAPRRGNTGHGDGVMDRVVATLLSELDGGGGGVGGSGHGKRESRSAYVVVIGATNRPDLLDPSLLRPGRFDRLLYLGPAKTKEHCLKILLAQTRKFRFDDGCSPDTVLKSAMQSFPPTLSGADLSAVASGALMRGLKRVCDRIEQEARSINLEKGFDEGSEMATDIDDVMESWPAEKLQPVLTADDFIEAAKEIVPSITSEDLERFEELQRQFSSGQFA